MDFTSYQLISSNTGSLNTGSYLNQTEYSLYVNKFTSDLWYGYSSNDVVELGVWDRNNNFIGWDVLHDSKTYKIISSSYTNTLDFTVPYTYIELQTDFILYKNEKILVSPSEELSSSFGIFDGSYFLTYNFTRNMAGDIKAPLIIKDISPSRKEIKLIPLGEANESYNAFCQKKVLVKDISPLYLESIKSCPYGQIYSRVNQIYKDEINTIKSLFYLNTDGAMVKFIQNLYEDLYIYTTVPKVTSYGAESSNDRLIRIQGIKTYFDNYLLSNSDNIVEFSDLDSNFKVFTSASIERKFAPIGAHPPIEYVKAKAFLYEFFTKHFYQPISDVLSSAYKEKYFTELKNALNIGNNRLLPILNSGFIDERIVETDSLTLIVKLKDEIPPDISLQSTCWVSNISFAPYVVNAIIKSPQGTITHKIGPPNFTLNVADVSLTNTNAIYTANDLAETDNVERELAVSRKLTEINIDYTDLKNFVVFSSAELRLKIFQNKVINLSTLNTSVAALEQQNAEFSASNGTIYPYYTQESDSLQTQITDIVNTFDGYESYLYRSGDFTYTGGAFVSSSYISELNTSASFYDKNNRDSLINNCPGHILADSNNDDYIVFLSMIGHFFDDIYIYIANMPSEKTVGANSTEDFTRRIVDYMLQTLGWDLDDSLEQATLLNNYLTEAQQSDLNIMSAEDRLKEIRNRILINLPRIYKTKGTEEAIRLILACYGIPSALLSVREYGGIDYTDRKAAYTTYERSFMYNWDVTAVNDYFRTVIVPDCKTYLFKVCLDDSSLYSYNSEEKVIGMVGSGSLVANDSSGILWSMGFTREKGQNLGKVFFKIGNDSDVKFNMTTSAFPLFDGNVYSVMLRRNLTPTGYEYNANTDAIPSIFDLWVQRNEFGDKILQISSSKVSYDYATNLSFSIAPSGSYLTLGNWFNNHAPFVGAMDKLQVWYDSITNGNFEDYVDSINAYSFEGVRAGHESLVFRMHTDYPFDVREQRHWTNANSFYASSASFKYDTYLDEVYPYYTSELTSVNTWSGSLVLVETTCSNYSQSTYPFQFKIVDYPSTWNISQYGPNKFRNEKVKHTTQIVAARFDNKERSTYTPRNATAPDSNQIGFFVDPQDFKNKDIIRYFGNVDLMDKIGDPNNRFSESYDSLKTLRYEYADSLNEYSGSRTLFNELITLYKLYFNRSVFEAIKNVIPARANVLTGVLIEPTVIERPKYQAKPVFSEANTGSVFYYDTTASHYYHDANTKLVRISESVSYGEFNVPSSTADFNYTTLPDNLSIDLNQQYLNLPTRDYSVNYLPQGNYVQDMLDGYQLGHVADAVVPATLNIPFNPGALPIANFSNTPNPQIIGIPVSIRNLSSNAIYWDWDFGDGSTSNVRYPITHTYTAKGFYDIKLTVEDPFHHTSNITKQQQIIHIPCSTLTYTGSVAWNDDDLTKDYTIYLGDGIGNQPITFKTYNNVPCRFVVNYDGKQVIDTGWIAQDAVAYSYVLGWYGIAMTLQGKNVGVTIFYIDGAGYPVGAITPVSAGDITVHFKKQTETLTATVKVYAARGYYPSYPGTSVQPFYVNNRWSFTSSCPTPFTS